ncbi:MAG: hypothetical protein F4X59_09990 [Holophagales bacterium]|nr:hypothetical protein [Holophagales bacterium]MYC10446.1 hypothetical protein [Holophagales bacterium]
MPVVLRRRSMDAERSGRGLFLAFFVGGGVLILLMKSLTASPLLAVLLPIGLMGSYACLLVEWPDMRPKVDFAGDNLYYLGFLYTLISLAISLYQFNTDGATSSIITNFGLALTSTILGLAGRILLNQPRDEEEAEARARDDLARANRRLRAEMEYSIDEFQQFRAEAKRVFEQLDRGVAAAGAALERQLEHLEGGAARFGALRRRVGEVDEAAAVAVRDIQAQRERFVSESQAVSDSLQQLLANFRSVDFRREFLEELIEPTSEQFRGLTREFLSVAEGLRSIEASQLRVMEQNQSAVARLTEILEENRRFSQANARAENGFRNATDALVSLRAHIDRYSEGTRAVVGELSAARRQLHDAPERMEAMNRSLLRMADRLDTVAEEGGRRRELQRWGL